MTSTAISAQGSVLQIATGTGGAKTLSAAAVGYPTIITSTAHGLNNGDVVTMALWAGTGAALLNGLNFVVQDVTTNTFMVEINTTGLTLTTGSTPTATPVTYTQVNNLKTFTGFDGEASEIDVTNLSSSAKEYRLGITDPGKFSIEVDQDNTDAGQLAVRASQAAGSLKSYKLILPDGHTFSFTAFCKKFASSLGVDQVVKGSIDFRISGAITLV
jgi:hypothetical protein